MADDGLRQAYAFIRQLVSVGADTASASTINLPSTASSFYITGTTSITTLGTTYSWNGRIVILTFAGALTLTHSSNLALPGAANIGTAANDCAIFRLEGGSAWRCISYQRAAIAGAIDATHGTYAPTPTNVSNASSITPQTTQYMRVGNAIVLGGFVTVNPDVASTVTEFRLSLPVPSNFTTGYEVGGTGVCTSQGTTDTPMWIGADTTNNELFFQYTCGDDTARTFSWHAIYTLQ